MAVCVDSILMVGPARCAQWDFFRPPRNDEVLVQRILFIQIMHILTVVIYLIYNQCCHNLGELSNTFYHEHCHHSWVIGM